MFDGDLLCYKNNICLLTEDKSFTYKEINELCNKIETFCPKEKQLVLVKAGINIETIIGYISCLRAHYAFIMLDHSIDKALEENILNIYKPNFIWERVSADFEYKVKIFNYGLRINNTEKLNLHKDLSLMLSTSGTTGSPKMVKLTKNNIYANCKSIVKYLKINSSHRAITNLPLYYSYGLSVLNTHLSQGASIVVNDNSIMSKEFWEAFKKFQVTTLNGVPYHYEILKKIGFMRMDLPSLKYLTQAGGKLNKKLIKEFATWSRETNIQFFVMYGQTEATARISYLPTDKTLEKVDSIGIAVPEGKLYIKDLNSANIVKDNFIDGELIYKGSNVMMGYATSLEDLSKGDELKGVLHTGDVAYKDKDNFFYITGRLKRFLKIHGNRVGLDEIEDFLKSLSYDVLCTGVDNKLMIATTNSEILDDIKQKIIDTYSFHHSVVKVKYIESYPITHSGKIQYQKLMEIF